MEKRIKMEILENLLISVFVLVVLYKIMGIEKQDY